MDSIMNYDRSEEDDFYRILGCDETANTEQILAEYKALSLLYHPDKNPDDADAVNRFQKIVKAKEILTDPEKRVMYDKWYRSGFAVPFEQFLNLNKAAHTGSVEKSLISERPSYYSVHWVTKKKKDLMIEDGAYDQNTQPGIEMPLSDLCFSDHLVGTDEEFPCRSETANVVWERDPASSLLKKFRNYEI